MKALVVSGGGAKGAYGGGVAQYLMQEMGRDYSLFVGTSTGSLLLSLLALGEIERLKEGYTNVTQKDIFKINPFVVKKMKDGTYKSDLNIINIIYNLVIRKQKTFGDSSNLRKLITKFFTEEDYNKVKNSNKDYVVCVVNITRDEIEYKSIKDYSYSDFCDWIWISSNAIPFMSLVQKECCDYGDGGIKEATPIQIAIDKGATEIDVIVLKEEKPTVVIENSKNVLHLIGRITDSMMSEISKDDISIAKLYAGNKDVVLNFYYLNRKLTDNSLVFDKEQMTQWWSEGFDYVKDRNFKSFLLTKSGKLKVIYDGSI